jgi:hypothetical protein
VFEGPVTKTGKDRGPDRTVTGQDRTYGLGYILLD